MHFLTLSALAASSFSCYALAAGVAAVHNRCKFPMWLQSVGDSSSLMITLPDQTVTYNETYRQRGAGGVSIKIYGSEQPSSANQTQFEYTHTPPNVWYDLSQIDGNTLTGVDYRLTPTDSSCPIVECAANDQKCKQVYNIPTDDHATHMCQDQTDLVFTLCPDGSGAAAPAASPSPPASAPVNAYVPPANNGPLGESAPGKPGVAAKKVANAPAAAAPAPASTPAPNAPSTDAMKYVNPVFPKVKRDEEVVAHIHQHAHQHAHQRLRRSRVFREGEAEAPQA